MKFFTVLLILGFLIGCSAAENPDAKNNELSDFDKLWDYNNPSETEKKFREILKTAEESGNVDYHAQLLTQIARTLGLQRKFEEAHKVLDEVEKMLTEDTKVARIRYMLERGRVFNSSGKKDEAKKLFLKAYEYGIANKLDYYAFDAVHMLGIAGTNNEQIEWNLKALKLCENTSDEKLQLWMGPVYNNLGWSYHDAVSLDEALKYFKKSLEWWEEDGNKQAIFIAKWNVAKCYRSLGRIDDAFKIQLKLKTEMTQEGKNPDGFVYEELGELYLLKNNEPEANKYFKLAYDILKKDAWLSENKPECMKRMKEFAEKLK
ncbi:MAG: hypothetical protein K8S87_07690 [Planctomycetes bacterium]|nr:hypothetical protein [Planctomycetota bacterium]